LRDLTVLSLDIDSIEDYSLLVSLTNLERLYLFGNHTSEQRDTLRALLPNSQVDFIGRSS